MKRNYDGFITEALVYNASMLSKEYGIPYDEGWDMIVDIFDSHDLVRNEPVNYIWAVLEAEKMLQKQYGPAYSWKYKK